MSERRNPTEFQSPNPGEWTFKGKAIADAFDQHVREQLPWYDLATASVAHIARHYIPAEGLVYDVGCATGNIGRAIADTLATRRARLIGIEASAEMASRYAGPGEVVVSPAEAFDFAPCDLIVCFLTLMFVPPAQRIGLIARMRDAVRPGGAIVIFEKIEPGRGYPATVLWRLTLAGKVQAGVDAGEIVAKELSLSGVQRPLSPAEIGPDAVEFFRFGDFAGWLIEAA